MSQKLKEPSGKIYSRFWIKAEDYIGTAFLSVLIILLVMMVVWVFTHYAKPIDGSSMQPGINNYDVASGDVAIVSYRTNMDYNDIVIVNMADYGGNDSDLAGRLLIKRVIAKSGDSIKFEYDSTEKRYYTYLKKAGETEFTKLEETFIKSMTNVNKYTEFTTQRNWVKKCTINEDGSVTIPDGYYFFMGDNRDVSLDCRNFGPLQVSTCAGVVESILPKGNVFNTILNWLANLAYNEE